jgi:peptide/nickel transport system permease protein
MTAQTQTISKIEAHGEQLRTKGLFQRAMSRLSRDYLTLAAIAVLALITLLSITAPIISDRILHVDPNLIDLSKTYAPPGTPGHVLGTDELGRDHLSRLLYAGQVSLAIGVAAAFLSIAIGVVVGVIAGYFRGRIDDFFLWFITTLNSIPSLFLLLMVAALLAPTPLSLVLILGFLGWTGTARIMRGEAIALKEREFVQAARSVGASNPRIMFLHIAPNVLSILIIDLASSIGGLSFAARRICSLRLAC